MYPPDEKKEEEEEQEGEEVEEDGVRQSKHFPVLRRGGKF